MPYRPWAAPSPRPTCTLTPTASSRPRAAEVEAFLAAHPQDRARVDAWQAQRQALRALLDPVLDEPLPLRLPLAPPARAWPWRALAAGIAVAVFSGGAAWIARGELDHDRIRAALAAAAQTPERAAASYAQRAAVAHAVYAPTWAGRLKSAATTKRPW